jgi:hypothetical protein
MQLNTKIHFLYKFNVHRNKLACVKFEACIAKELVLLFPFFKTTS